MSTSANPAAFDSASLESDAAAPPQLTADPQMTREDAGTAPTDAAAGNGLPQTRPRRNKRDYDAATETNADAPDDLSSPPLPAAKKPTAGDRDAAESSDAAAARKTAVIDIDQKHAHDPQYASKLAPSVYKFLRHLESLVLRGNGQTLTPAKNYENLAERRTKCINVLFGINNKSPGQKHLQVPTNTMHLAIYYIDRFLERYTGAKDLSIPLITATALFLASKFEDVTPIDIETILKARTFGKDVKLTDVLGLEVRFFKELHLMGAPTITAFAHRYMQAVDMEMNLAAVHTARYFSALGAAHFPLTGQKYSKIAAAAAFIAYNKYRSHLHPSSSPDAQNSSTGIEYPESLRYHSQYTANEVKEVVMELLDVAKQVETVASIRSNSSCRDRLPIEVYLYYKRANVVGTCILPNYGAFFTELEARQQAEREQAERELAEAQAQSSSGSHDETGEECTAAVAAPEGDTAAAVTSEAVPESPAETEASTA